jgi:hypothetical protein
MQARTATIAPSETTTAFIVTGEAPPARAATMLRADHPFEDEFRLLSDVFRISKE